ncbi:D-alanine--D-alanine ligase family protein [Rhizomicrobium electricum]|uniref:D-alanine--D-alanine ligase n=1 Tax=Rhizomicrobium electricum TaxID=480070 RepID=A0ABP3PCK2_9PROT|nr:D-alanine--D-alanine ligase [Rhizomicrobium electricum]NIJ48746.1 D-alanine-D-alanine ligase [Rhizomicrobium electricum]
MRIGVTYDLKSDYLAQGWSEEDAAEFDSERTIAAICEALVALGLEPVRIGTVKRLAERLVAGERWDGVFNFCEGVKGLAREAQVPALLEAYDIPYVFSDTLTLAVSLDKAMCKRIVRDAGVPTPDFAVIETPADADHIDLPYPLFLKPVAEGSGKGVDRNSRVEDAAGLKAVAADLLKRFAQPVLVETFLPGREFTVGITGTGADAEVLGVTEIVPLAGYVGAGYGYENKQEEWEDKLAIELAPPEFADAAGKVALKAWRALRCRDGGRIDVRCDASGRPQFIEVNPLAGLNPGFSDLCLIAEFKGISYNDLIGRFMASFFKRNPQLAS